MPPGRFTLWLFQADHRDLQGFRGACIRFLRVAYLTAQEFRGDFCFERAASLTFATILSIVPLTVLFVTIAGSLGAGEGERVTRFVETTLIPLLAPQFQEPLAESLRNTSKQAFREWPTGLISLVASAALFAGALGILLHTERVFNRIWKVRGNRSYVQKAVVFWVILTTSPILIVSSMWVRDYLLPEGGFVRVLVNSNAWLEVLYDWLLPIAIDMIGFGLFFLFIPSTKVRLGSAFLGGFVAALLWEASKFGFHGYVSWAGRETDFVKYAFAIPLFLVWIYVTWAIALCGGEVCAVHQNLESLSRDRRRLERATPHRALAASGLFLLVRVAEAFRDGKGAVALADLASQFEVDDAGAALQDAAQRMVAWGWLVEDATSPASYCLARDPGQIELRDITDRLGWGELPEVRTPRARGEGAGAADPYGRARELLLRARDRALDDVGGATLADLSQPDGESAPLARTSGARPLTVPED